MVGLGGEVISLDDDDSQLNNLYGIPTPQAGLHPIKPVRTELYRRLISGDKVVEARGVEPLFALIGVQRNPNQSEIPYKQSL